MWTANLFLYRDMSIYWQEPHPKRRAGQSFLNCGLKITYIVREWTSSLSGSVNRRINREWQRSSLSNMQRKKGSKRIEIIIKMHGKRIQTHRRPFCTPNPDADLCMCVDLPPVRVYRGVQGIHGYTRYTGYTGYTWVYRVYMDIQGIHGYTGYTWVWTFYYHYMKQ